MVEFLSLGKIDVKETRATGDSDVNGPWAVEDVRIQNSLYRRLVFLSSQNLVQSEVKLIRKFIYFKNKIKAARILIHNKNMNLILDS